jgi:hypothetical protein
MGKDECGAGDIAGLAPYACTAEQQSRGPVSPAPFDTAPFDTVPFDAAPLDAAPFDAAPFDAACDAP